jgi:hypothetical protein
MSQKSTVFSVPRVALYLPWFTCRSIQGGGGRQMCLLLHQVSYTDQSSLSRPNVKHLVISDILMMMNHNYFAVFFLKRPLSPGQAVFMIAQLHLI